jgi:hypothetical protein
MRVDGEDVLTRTTTAACGALAEEPTGFDALRRFLRDALDVGIAVMHRIHGEGTLRPDATFESLERLKTAGGR